MSMSRTKIMSIIFGGKWHSSFKGEISGYGHKNYSVLTVMESRSGNIRFGHFCSGTVIFEIRLRCLR